MLTATGNGCPWLQVALVRSLLDRSLARLEGLQRQRKQAAALQGGGGTDAETPQDSAADGTQGAQQQPTVQVATVDSFQVGRGFELPCWYVAWLRLRACCGSLPPRLPAAPLQGAECDVVILTTTVTRSSNFASGVACLN